MRTLILAGIALAAAPIASAQQDGKGWCFQTPDVGPAANVYAGTEKLNTGAWALTVTNTQGIKSTVELRSVGVNEYALKDSEHGEGVIFRADGHIEMYNSEGSRGSAAPSSEADCIGNKNR